MILVIGTQNCSRCNMTKSVLMNNNIIFEYKLISEFTQEEQNQYLKIAKENNQKSFPLILEDNKLITLQEATNVH